MAHLDIRLLHLVGELEGTLVTHVAHGRLERVEATSGAKLLGRRYHAHVDVLLMSSLQLLLLLLEELDLLLDSKLVHCRGRVLAIISEAAVMRLMTR